MLCVHAAVFLASKMANGTENLVLGKVLEKAWLILSVELEFKDPSSVIKN